MPALDIKQLLRGVVVNFEVLKNNKIKFVRYTIK